MEVSAGRLCSLCNSEGRAGQWQCVPGVWGRGGRAMSRVVPRLVLLSTSWEPPRPWGHTAAPQPQLWQHGLAGAEVDTMSCCAAWGGCVCPRAPGQCEGSLRARLPAQHHLLSLGSAGPTQWDNALPLWSVSKWGWVGRTQAYVVSGRFLGSEKGPP